MKPIFKMVPLAELASSSTNPRTDFNSAELVGLAQSILAFGILQPLVVRPVKSGYEIIAGHRRAAAAALAELKEVPCVVRMEKGENAAQQLVENIQRVDLRPLEIAGGVGRALASGKKIKQAELAAQLGRSDPWVSKFKTIAQAVAKFGEQVPDLADADKVYEAALALLHPEKVSSPEEDADGEGEPAGESKDDVAIRAMIEKGCEKAKINQAGVVVIPDENRYDVRLTFDNADAAKKFFRRVT